MGFTIYLLFDIWHCTWLNSFEAVKLQMLEEVKVAKTGRRMDSFKGRAADAWVEVR